jgi:hypothetical protein
MPVLALSFSAAMTETGNPDDAAAVGEHDGRHTTSTTGHTETPRGNDRTRA